jgi:choline dehydrogenase
VVGAGSSGAVLATRLSEVPRWKILLLEAGDEETDFSRIPSMVPYLQTSPMEWGYLSTPQNKSCLGAKNRRCTASRSRSIGGCSAHNALLYVRGNADDYDNWVRLGNPGWSFDEVLPYFIKSENSQIDGDEGYHGKGGFWNVQRALPVSPYLDNFIEGNKELGREVVDYNGRQQLGVSQLQVNVKHGKRQSTGTAFLDNARQRANLNVITGALVVQIVIDESTKSARGVVFVKDDTKFSANASKEVIVSGGAFNSPQLLMLSGIGPKEHLRDLGIEVIQDLPVGKILLNHPYFLGLTFRTNLTVKTDLKEDIRQYLRGVGPLANPANCDGVGFLHAGDIPKTVPMLEYVYVPPKSTLLTTFHNLQVDDELLKNYFDKIDPATDIVLSLVLLHEKSRGSLTLKSNSPVDFPNIDYNFLDAPEDVDNFIEGIEFVLKLMRTKAFREIDATLLEIPVCGDFQRFSRSFWECALRQMTNAFYHSCGTTPMGPNKTTSVVDTNLKVHGIDNLRVVDAGVIPSTLSGHPNAPCVMIAEKISDVIKNTYGTT